MKIAAAILTVCIVAVSIHAQEPPLREWVFEETDADFPNPERGWYKFRDLPEASGFNLRTENKTLVFGRILANDFKDRPFTQDFLDAIQAGFDLARENGIKVNPRVAYNDGPEAGCAAEYGCDAPKDVIMGHIAQLKPLWEANKDVINLVDPGFIGGWGEWHTSSNGLNNPTDQKDILFAILDALPQDRMVYVRYPALKREIFGGSKQAQEPVLDSSRAFDGSNLARVGHLNDCFLSGSDDVGTYQYGWTREQNLDYIGAESRYVPFGGETCAVHTVGECANTLYEMEKLHINHLNRDYHPGVIQRWQDQGCYDEITRRLGYRFALASARLPDSVRPGGTLRLEFTVRNTGFGELFNPRDVEVVLLKDGLEQAAVLPADPRWWGAGQSVTVSAALSIPAAQEEGTYSLGLRLPDKSESIRGDVRYAIQFANAGVWNALPGVNVLTEGLVISGNAAGDVDEAFTAFAVIEPGTPVNTSSADGKTGGIKYRFQIKGNQLLFNIQTSTAVQGKITLIDLSGRNIASRKVALSGADQEQQVPVSAAQPGMYILEARFAGNILRRKLVLGTE